MTASVPSAANAVLREAIAYHQAGKLTEAETLYRQVLAVQPDFAEVHVNLAIVLMFRGNLDAAMISCRRGLLLKPDYAKGHCYLGDILAFQGRPEEAVPCYQQALTCKPDYAEAHNNLGNAFLRLSQWAEAALSYGRALAAKPDIAEAHNNLGLIHLRGGHFEEAQAAFARAVAIAPGYAEAHNNSGHILLQQSKPDQAADAFRRALAVKPDYAEAHSNLGAALGERGKLDEAAACCLRAIAARPDYAEAHNNLGNVLKKQGKLAAAEACYRKALACKPGFSEAHKHLAAILCEDGRISEGFAAYTRHAETTGPDASLSAGPSVAHKDRHDAEQQAWLGDRAAAFTLGDGRRIAGPAVNPANRVAEISETWRTAQPQIVVIDDLLTAEALQKLRLFCLDSTIWRAIYEGGYLGAFPEHGFAPPLLAQIAEELRAVYPAIIGDHPLLHFWAFKYDSSLRGINKHADFAAVNVNFWITPDSANLDPEHGGLVVWDTAAPLDWDFARYNAANDDIRAFLEHEKAKAVTVPYRANRAVVFDSDLFHETDTIHFKPGYENRRINVTLLFGRRQESDNA
ncbi:MAG TPA: tetratricopeptide repeat protein [Rhizomicrobium sp.]|nr:tetratricopeptide repeat protein [Rhizomicrobium sp.]